MFLKNTNLHIRRFEFKYLIKEKNLDNIRRSIGYFVEIDPYCRILMQNYYPVTSLYFDDLGFSSYFEKLSGVKLRKKLRLRVYGNKVTNLTKVFMEVKKKDDIVVFKDRAITNYFVIKDVLEKGNYDSLELTNNWKDSESFLSQVLRKRLSPCVLVSYKREAYLDKNNSSFRITLDRDLSARKSLELDFNTQDNESVFGGYAILEAKFNRVMPAWFGRVIRSNNLTRVSFSKYCVSLASCGIVPNNELSDAFIWT